MARDSSDASDRRRDDEIHIHRGSGKGIHIYRHPSDQHIIHPGSENRIEGRPRDFVRIHPGACPVR